MTEEDKLPEPKQLKTIFTGDSELPTTFIPAREVATTFFIKAGVMIPGPAHKKFVSVLRPFYVRLTHVEDGYAASSLISDIYEQGESVGSAIRSYLYSLADELLWLQKRKENLSKPLLEQLITMQFHLQII